MSTCGLWMMLGDKRRLPLPSCLARNQRVFEAQSASHDCTLAVLDSKSGGQAGWDPFPFLSTLVSQRHSTPNSQRAAFATNSWICSSASVEVLSIVQEARLACGSLGPTFSEHNEVLGSPSNGRFPSWFPFEPWNCTCVDCILLTSTAPSQSTAEQAFAAPSHQSGLLASIHACRLDRHGVDKQKTWGI